MNTANVLRLTADDLDQYEEIAIATAQSQMESVIANSGLPRSIVAEIMGRPRSFISKIMNGGHNLTIRTMARLFAACGQELRFSQVSTVAHWDAVTLSDDHSHDLSVAYSESPAQATPVASAGDSEYQVAA